MMIPLNIIWITTLRTIEFLDCIDIYNNEFFVVVKREDPWIIGFPIVMLNETKEKLWYTEIVEITKRQINRVEIFGKEDPGLGKIYLLMDKKNPIFAFVRFTPFKTYPTIANFFRNGKLFNDYLVEYYKPFLPPREVKRIIEERRALNKEFNDNNEGIIINPNFV